MGFNVNVDPDNENGSSFIGNVEPEGGNGSVLLGSWRLWNLRERMGMEKDLFGIFNWRLWNLLRQEEDGNGSGFIWNVELEAQMSWRNVGIDQGSWEFWS